MRDLSVKDSINLPVPPISQMLLAHPRARHLCSPTSTSAVVNYLKGTSIKPIPFSSHVHDNVHDIYGNWVLNTAHAAALLGKPWHCWVQRLYGFDELYEQLKKGIPVVVSIKGPLEGAPLPYEEGHLIVVKGYDASKKHVLCMDPAYPTHAETSAAYPYESFMDAWGRRRLAYFFCKAE